MSLLSARAAIRRPLLSLACRSLSQAVTSIASVDPSDKDGIVTVQWADGKASKYTYAWLRDNCPEDHTFLITPTSHSRMLLWKDFDINVRPTKISGQSDGLKIVWPEDKDSFYSAQWLKDRDSSDPALAKARILAQHEQPKKTWNKEGFESFKKAFNWSDILTSDQSQYDALVTLNDYGFVLITDMPQEPGQGDRLKDILGYYQHSYYGEKFQVKAKSDPSNLSYTPAEVGFHLDLPPMETLPQVQCLHCISSAGDGGENTFVDGFEVANQIKRDHPDHHTLLTSVPVEYVDDICDEGKSFIQMARHPVIRLDDNGAPKIITWSNHLRSWYYDLPPERIHKLYEAFKIFQDYCHDPANVAEYKMASGECAIFDNHRLLHGRKAYKATPGTNRHLEGFYFTWDAIKSKIRVLHEKLGLEPKIVCH